MRTHAPLALLLLLAGCDGGGSSGAKNDASDSDMSNVDADDGGDSGDAEPDEDAEDGPDGGGGDTDAAEDGGGEDGGSADAGSDADADAPNLCEGMANGSSCGTDLTCCSEKCTNINRDQRNCGSCGNDCTSVGYCAKAATFSCQPLTFHGLCANGSIVQITDDAANDDAAGEALANAIGSHCGITPSKKSNTDPTIVEGKTYKLLAGTGTAVVIAGGPGIQGVQYALETEAKASPVYTKFGEGSGFWKRGGTTPLVAHSLSVSDCTRTSAEFAIQLYLDPVGGAVVLAGYGFCAEGTAAAPVFFTKEIVPNLATETKTWWVVKWQDANGNMTPEATDTFSIVDSGS